MLKSLLSPKVEVSVLVERKIVEESLQGMIGKERYSRQIFCNIVKRKNFKFISG